MRKIKIDADIDTPAQDAPNISILYISLVYHCLTWMLWSFPAVLQHVSKVGSHWLRHAVYHPNAQQGICHWKSGTTTAKVGLESGVPWKKQWNTGTIQTFFMSSFGVSKCSLGKTKLNDMQLIQHMLDMFDMYTRMYLHMVTFWIHVCLHVCIDVCTSHTHTHTNIHIYSSTHMNDKYPLWYYLFTVTYLCITIMPGVYPMCCRSPFCCSLWPQRSTETKRKERKLEEGIAPVWSGCVFSLMFWLVVLERFCGWVNHSSVFLVGGDECEREATISWWWHQSWQFVCRCLEPAMPSGGLFFAAVMQVMCPCFPWYRIHCPLEVHMAPLCLNSMTTLPTCWQHRIQCWTCWLWIYTHEG